MRYTEDGNPVPETLHEQRVLYMERLNKAARLIDGMTSDPNERIILKTALLKSLKKD